MPHGQELFNDRVRAVLFDAVGTLISPSPPVTEAYHAYAARHGSQLGVESIARRFQAAYRGSFSRCGADGRTDEAAERARWRGIVAEVFDDVVDRAGLVDELWEHFARPSSWRLDPAVPTILARLRERQVIVGVASNFDGRLRNVLAGTTGWPPDMPLFISSELGWQKPHRQFFRAIEQRLQIPPESILLIGDDWENDISAAQAAGWQTIWVAPWDTESHEALHHAPCVRTLDEVLRSF